MTEQLTPQQECYQCANKYNIPGNCHIGCSTPSSDVKGDEYGIANGWFIYPYCFDPIWKINHCPNFKPVESDTSNTETK